MNANYKENISEWLESHATDGRYEFEGDYKFRWTWIDDEGDACGVSELDALAFDVDCNGVRVVFAEFDDGSRMLDRLDYPNVAGDNFCDYLCDYLAEVDADLCMKRRNA